jgi:hypothetical protein
MLGENRLSRRCRKGQRTGERVKSHHAKRIEIAPPIQRLAARLLGTHELRRTEQLTDRGLAGRVCQPRDPEVGDEGALSTALEEDVRRLHVTMHDALGMCIRQRPCDLTQDARDFVCRQRTARGDPVGERLAVDVGHDDEHEPANLVDGVDRHDVRVGQTRRGGCLVHEPVAKRVAGSEVGREQLDRDEPVEANLAREVDHTHSATSQLTLQRVAPGDGLLKREKKCVDLLGHDSLSRTE